MDAELEVTLEEIEALRAKALNIMSKKTHMRLRGSSDGATRSAWPREQDIKTQPGRGQWRQESTQTAAAAGQAKELANLGAIIHIQTQARCSAPRPPPRPQPQPHCRPQQDLVWTDSLRQVRKRAIARRVSPDKPLDWII